VKFEQVNERSLQQLAHAMVAAEELAVFLKLWDLFTKALVRVK
jgi:hypothetical protein